VSKWRPDLGEDSGAGPDHATGHGGQDGVKRVGLQDAFDLRGDFFAMPAERGELFR
jgi:hypothetical protein